MELRRVRLSDEEVAPLLAGLTIEYETRYGQNSEMTRARAEEFEPPAGLFVVLMDGPTTAAGGGFRRVEADTAEIKRMWTAAQYRRRGLATRVLQALEDAARDVGYRRLVLETGLRQPEAIALYAGRGYQRFDGFGEYPHARGFSLDLGER